MTWQEEAEQFAQQHNFVHGPGVYILDLVSELGEVAKEVLRHTHYGANPIDFQRNVLAQQRLAGELGDVLYSLCLLASSAGINLDQAFQTTLQKYDQRWLTTQSIGNKETVL